MPHIDILVRGSERLRDTLMSRGDGGTRIDEGLAELIAAADPNADVRVSFQAGRGSAALRAELESGPSPLREAAPNLVIVSIDEEFDIEPPVSAERLLADYVAIIDMIKQDPGSHVIMLNVCTADPAVVVSNYRNEAGEPRSLTAQRYDLSAMRLSFETGISVLDVDRIVAELGADQHGNPFLEYSAQASSEICRELVSVITEYGFFDDRSLLPQVGREAASS